MAASDDLEPQIEYLSRYDVCAPFVSKLLPTHLMQFVENILFSQKSIEMIQSKKRIEILKHIFKFAKQEANNNKKTIEVPGYCSLSWNETATKLEDSLMHLNSVNNDTLKQLRGSDDEKLRRYANQYEIAQSNSEMLIKLLRALVLEGADIAVVNNLLEASPVLKDLSLHSLVVDTISACVAIICGEPHDLIADISDLITTSNDCLSLLTTGLNGFKNYTNSTGDSQFTDEYLLSEMRAIYLRNISLDLKGQKTRLLELIDSTFTLPSDDVVLLTYFHTKSIVDDLWSELQLTYEIFAESPLFDHLLKEAVEVKHFDCISRLIDRWHSPDYGRIPHGKLVISRIAGDEPELSRLFYLLVESMANQAHKFNRNQQIISLFTKYCDTWKEEEIIVLLNIMRKSTDNNVENNEILTSGEFNCLMCTLSCDLSNLYYIVPEILKDITQFNEFDCTPLFEMIVKRNIVSSLVTLPTYKQFIEYAMTNIGATSPSSEYTFIENTIASLVNGEYIAESAYLTAFNSSTDGLLNSFSRSLYPYLNITR